MSRDKRFKNEIKANIIRAGYSMQDIVDIMAEDYGWSRSISNFPGKLSRGSLRYEEAAVLMSSFRR